MKVDEDGQVTISLGTDPFRLLCEAAHLSAHMAREVAVQAFIAHNQTIDATMDAQKAIVAREQVKEAGAGFNFGGISQETALKEVDEQVTMARNAIKLNLERNVQLGQHAQVHLTNAAIAFETAKHVRELGPDVTNYRTPDTGPSGPRAV